MTKVRFLAKWLAIFLCVFLFFSCAQDPKNTHNKIAVFIPGVMANSPVYEMLAEGVTEAVEMWLSNDEASQSTSVQVIEAGVNQAEWAAKITALAATGEYSVIISSNPSLPEIIEPLTSQFPQQQFIILDAFNEGNKNIATLRYNQREQAFVTGYAAALVSLSDMEFANKEKRIGFIAAQEYPVMNNVLLPAFIEGAKAVDEQMIVDFRLVGNWYDATKGAELAKSLYESGADVILPIAGGAGVGVVSAARELGFYITWFDDNGFDKAPGYVVSSTALAQKRAAFELTTDFLNGEIDFGVAKTVGMSDGYVLFDTSDPLYIETLSQENRQKMEVLVDSIVDGMLQLPQK